MVNYYVEVVSLVLGTCLGLAPRGNKHHIHGHHSQSTQTISLPSHLVLQQFSSDIYQRAAAVENAYCCSVDTLFEIASLPTQQCEYVIVGGTAGQTHVPTVLDHNLTLLISDQEVSVRNFFSILVNICAEQPLSTYYKRQLPLWFAASNIQTKDA